MSENLEQLKYPIGRFQMPTSISDSDFDRFIETIRSFPEKIRKETENLSDEQLDTIYRPGGWTIRQIVHHCADSHMNGYGRFKLALTENHPTIKPYDQDAWAALADCKTYPIRSSLIILEGLHERWAVALKATNSEQRERTFVHPEHGAVFTINQQTANYDWHCRQHLAHITELKKRMNF